MPVRKGIRGKTGRALRACGPPGLGTSPIVVERWKAGNRYLSAQCRNRDPGRDRDVERGDALAAGKDAAKDVAGFLGEPAHALLLVAEHEQPGAIALDLRDVLLGVLGGPQDPEALFLGDLEASLEI